MGRDAILVDDGHANSSFNPRARVGRDCRLLLDRYRSQTVSIHAPAWGATFVFGSCISRQKCFNPRARVGRDITMEELYFEDKRVSIHAPAWGATFSATLISRPVACFNPRARVGRDPRQG